MKSPPMPPPNAVTSSCDLGDMREIIGYHFDWAMDVIRWDTIYNDKQISFIPSMDFQLFIKKYPNVALYRVFAREYLCKEIIKLNGDKQCK